MISISNDISISGLPASLSGGGANNDFVIEVNTTKAGSASDTIILPLESGGTYSGTIDWGDGSSDDLTYANRQHTYASGGTYTITISGDTLQGWAFKYTGDRLKITDVSNWGTIFEFDRTQMFTGCSNMDVSATDIPTISTTDMTYNFYETGITNPDWSGWDMSGVTNYSLCFTYSSNFNGNIGNWVTSATTDINNMLNGCSSFNQDLSGWDTSGITNWNSAFRNATAFNGSVAGWTLNGNLTDVFRDATSFTGIGMDSWDTSGITYLLRTFYNADVQVSDLTGWDVSNVTYVNSLFYLNPSFNADCGGWSWDSATTLTYIFAGTIFNQDIDDWTFHPTATNINAFGMLSSCSLNTSIDSWDVSGFSNMGYMFLGCPYSQSLNSWDVSNVTDMQWMFRGGGNPNITSWDVSSVSNMSRMFQDNSSFNQNIGGWNTASLSNISLMFYNADAFDQNIGGWDWANITSANSFMQQANGLSTANYDSTLVGIEANLQTAYPGGVGYPATININFGGSQFTLGGAGETAKNSLVLNFGWTISDGGGI